jgi:5-methylcytosine-specific restriction protein A
MTELKPGQKTRTADLALVCANCHRMLHRGRLVTLERLRASMHK